MSVRRTAVRSLGALVLCVPLASGVLLATATPALAAGSITSPAAGAVFSNGGSITASASIGMNSGRTTFTVSGPGGYSSSKTVENSLTSSQTVSITVSTGGGTAVRNGQWTATLAGGATGSRTFFTHYAPGAPGAFTAQGSGSRDVAFSWTKGTEPDLTGYVLYDGSGATLDSDISLADAGCTSSSACTYAIYYPGDHPGTHSYQLAAKRPGGGCSGCADPIESSRASTSATLEEPPPPPPPSPEPTTDPGGTTGGSTTGGSTSGGSTGGTSGTTGTSTGGSTGGSSGGSTSGGSTSGGSTSGGSVQGAPKATLPSLPDPILASRKAFALRFNAFSPSLGIPKLPPLPAIQLPRTSEAPLPEGTYNPSLPYQPQTEVEKTSSFASQPIAAVRDALDSERLARSLAGALLLLLVGAHLRRYLGAHVSDD